MTYNSNDKKLDDAELVEACLDGDSTAFEQLVEKYQNLAMALALSYVQNFHDAQELVQEAFLKAYLKLVQLKNPSRFSSWFSTIVVNCCRAWLRKQSRTFSLLDTSIQTELSYLSIQRKRQKELHSSVWNTVNNLPEKYRTVVLLYYMNDYSYHEISEFLDLPVTTVKGRLQQARLKLRRELNPEEKEELRMSQVNSEFSERVKDTACQIAQESIKETVSFKDTEHLILFLGVNADVEVRQHDKDNTEVTGIKYSLGNQKQDAQKSISTIQILTDATENYWEEGPHQAEVFTSTDMKEGNPVAVFCSANDSWKWFQSRLTEEQEPVSSILYNSLKKATRVTIGRQKGEDIILSREAYTDEVQRIFFPNWNDDKQMHGPIGYVNLVISLPPEKNFTLIGGRTVKISDLCDDLYLIGCSKVFLEKIKGTVCLYDSHLAKVENVEGRLVQYFHRFGGGNWDEPHAVKRSGAYETKIQKIAGEVHIDVGKVQIEASEVEDKATIKNRFGTTRFYQTTPRTNGTCEIQSVSGDVLLFLNERTIGEINVATKTSCGKINFSGLKDLGLSTRNNPHEIYVGTVRNLEEADVKIQTESGDIRIEKMMES